MHLLRAALELALHDPAYEDIAVKFFEHFLSIAGAINGAGEDRLGLWDESDEFYYDQLVLPDNSHVELKIYSIVGLIPLFANQVLEPEVLQSAAGVLGANAMVSRAPSEARQSGLQLAYRR